MARVHFAISTASFLDHAPITCANVLRLKTFGGLVIRRDGAPVEGAGSQRRRLALLALLAAAGERGLSRERLLGLLWPESDLERARKNLAQAVYALRRDLGVEDLITGTADLRLNTDYITSDLAEFRRAVSEGRLEDAVALYDGPFLDGVYLDEAPEFERWAEQERNVLQHEYVAALEQLARKAGEAGDHRTAVAHWRRLANADPLNAQVAAGLMEALAAQGDRAAALQHYRVYEMLLRQELELEPDARLKALADSLRKGPGPAPTPTVVDRGEIVATPGEALPPRPEAPPRPAPPPERKAEPLAEPPAQTLRATPAVARPIRPPAPPKEPPREVEPVLSGLTDEYARPRPLPPRETGSPAVATGAAGAAALPRKPLLKRTSTRIGLAIGFGLGLVLMIALGLMSGRQGGAARPSIVAVGTIQDYTHERDGLTRPLADMLATDLARVPGFQVISTARMYELMAQDPKETDSTARVVRAARASGATELVDGALHSMRDGRYRLDLKRTDLATGGVIASYSSEADDLFALVSEARRQLAGAADSAATGSLADVTTRSMVAYRLYEEGLREMMSQNGTGARRLFEQALAEDSTFAMAAYWLARTGGAFNDPGLIRGLERAMRLAERASDRERLLIRAGWAAAADHPSRVAVAETLTVRYPSELEGYLYLGTGRAWGGDFLGAITPLRRVIALDSAALRVSPGNPGAVVRCYACDAYRELLSVYHLLDSLPAYLRVSQEWFRRQPSSGEAATAVANAYLFTDRFVEAQAASQAVTAVAPAVPQEGYRAQLAIRSGDLATAEAFYQTLAEGTWAGEGWKWLTIIRRTAGKPRAGFEPARKLRDAERAPRGAAPYNALFEAQLWYDLGEYRRAAATFDSITRAPRDSTPSQLARNKVWTQTLRATALFAAGDTALLPALADSIEAWGQGSSYGRDRRLHHHVRGLIAEARGQYEVAASEFERAIFSPVLGYTRTNYELAKVLLRLNRPREAVRWVTPALRGPYDGANTYTTRTELLELAALAWDAAGERDSALARYRDVLRNWSGAEPPYHARLERARLRVAALSAQ
jgi:DNA-binding SARP family transcriptional activator/TolB-like protein